MFKSLPGFREFYPEECSIRNHIFKLWRQSSRMFGFQEYDAPILEPLELLTAKSGEEIVGQLFSFEDKGGRAVTLRPEMTPSLARLVAAKANSMPKPIKWFSIGENFRYERPQKGRLRSFYQLNCDILGEPSPAADAEIIALLIRCFTCFGLTANDFCVRLSDRDLWVYFLHKCGLQDDNTIQHTLSIIDKMERESPEKTLEKLKEVFGKKAESFLAQATELASLDTLKGLQDFFKKESSEDLDRRLEDWIHLLGTLSNLGLDAFIKIDLKIVRGLAYYTGFVFEAFQLIGKGRALAGGGRYDHLVKKLGGPEVPAVGFGFGDVTFRDLLELKGLVPKYIDKPDFYVAFEDPVKGRRDALKDVAEMRKLGYRVEYSLKISGNGIRKQLKAANQLGAHFALIYGEDELKNNTVTIKDLNQRKEITVTRKKFFEEVEQIHHEGGLPATDQA